VREARDRHGLRFEGHFRRGRRGARKGEREDGEAENGNTAGCSTHQFFSPLLMDRSASIRLAPEPWRSGDIEIPAGGTVASCGRTLSALCDAFKIEPPDQGTRSKGPKPVRRS